MEADQFLTRLVLNLQLQGDPGSVFQELNRFSGTPSNDPIKGMGGLAFRHASSPRA
jgi:hypothetical protein